MTVKSVFGDATDPVCGGYRIIAHVCNNVGAFGKGFAAAVAAKWPHVADAYKKRRWSTNWTLGENQWEVAELDLNYKGHDIVICNMIAQKGLRSRENPIPLQYDALEKCLSNLAEAAAPEDASIHMPMIGSGLSGGDWEKIKQMIDSQLRDRRVWIYHFK